MILKTAVDNSVAAVSVQSAAGLPSLGVRSACDAEREFSGAVLAADLLRVSPLVPRAAPETFLNFEMRFYRNAGRDLLADIDVRTDVELDCSRCLQPMTVAVVGSSTLQFVYNDEQAQHVMDDCEPVLIDEEGMVSLASLLEDEVLMSMPTVAMHDHQCRPTWQEASDAPEQVVESDRSNPFAALAQQWHQSDDPTDP